jgi:hypothetical protein
MASGGKVVHISDEVHARVRAHCKERRIPMREWIEDLVLAALDGQIDAVRSSTVAPSPALSSTVAPSPALSSTVAVEKKPLPTIAEETGDEPWSRPPFWARQRRSA